MHEYADLVARAPPLPNCGCLEWSTHLRHRSVGLQEAGRVRRNRQAHWRLAGLLKRIDGRERRCLRGQDHTASSISPLNHSQAGRTPLVVQAAVARQTEAALLQRAGQQRHSMLSSWSFRFEQGHVGTPVNGRIPQGRCCRSYTVGRQKLPRSMICKRRPTQGDRGGDLVLVVALGPRASEATLIRLTTLRPLALQARGAARGPVQTAAFLRQQQPPPATSVPGGVAATRCLLTARTRTLQQHSRACRHTAASACGFSALFTSIFTFCMHTCQAAAETTAPLSNSTRTCTLRSHCAWPLMQEGD